MARIYCKEPWKENQQSASLTRAFFPPRASKVTHRHPLSFSQGKTGPTVSEETGMASTGMLEKQPNVDQEGAWPIL